MRKPRAPGRAGRLRPGRVAILDYGMGNLRAAIEYDDRVQGVPSTKGVL